MIGWIVLGVLVSALLVPAGLGGRWRAKRLGVRDGLLRPLLFPLGCIVLFGGFFAAIFWLSGFVVAFLFALALMGVAAGLLLPGLGLDEFMDRVTPGFWACVRRELYRQFFTPIPWFVLFLYTVLCGWFFWDHLTRTREIVMWPVWGTVAFLGSFLFPLLTMGLYARERSEGTIEVLMTAPVSPTSVTLAKFLSTTAFYIVMLAPTLLYLGILTELGQDIGKPDPGPTITSYLGLVLFGAFYISMGLFCSALTSSQILAALLSWVFILFFILIGGALPSAMGFAGTELGAVLEYSQPLRVHLLPFLKGVVDPKNVVFFVSFTVFFLFLGTRAIESRKGR